MAEIDLEQLAEEVREEHRAGRRRKIHVEQKMGEWQPIDTAPHDRDLLVYFPGAPIPSIRRIGEWHTKLPPNWRATHWMPLPEPPRDEK